MSFHDSKNLIIIHCSPIVWNHLLVPLFCPTAGANLCLCQCKDLDDIQKTSRDHLTKFYGLWSTTPMSSRVQPSYSVVLFFSLASKAVGRICVDHIQLWAAAVCKNIKIHCGLITDWKCLKPIITLYTTTFRVSNENSLQIAVARFRGFHGTRINIITSSMAAQVGGRNENLVTSLICYNLGLYIF